MKIHVSGLRSRYISSSVTTTATTTSTTRRTARTVGKYAGLAAGALTALGLAFAAEPERLPRGFALRAKPAREPALGPVSP